MSFLRFFEGATPGKQRKLSADDKKAGKKKYETERKRSFQPSWKVNRPWLAFNEAKGQLECTVCQQFAPESEFQKNSFIKGSTYLRLDGIKSHETSDCHKKCITIQQAKNTPIAQCAAGKALMSLKKADHDRLIIKMRNAHAIAKHSLSFKTYEVICKLDDMKEIDSGSQYCSDRACARLCESIARTTRADVVNKIDSCSWCSISCDGSTDFTGEDMEAVYIRTCTKGVIEDSFLHLGASESACSEDIFNFLMETLRQLKIEDTVKAKLVGFCADGASNMQGLKKGVAALLKQKWPYLITTHCLAHRLELSFKDAVKSSSPKLYEKATTLLLGIYYLFRKSPKRKKGLQRAFEVVGQKQLLPTRIGGTRWLPHVMRAINIFLKTYKVLRYQLENSSHNNPKAEGLARLLRDGHVIVYIVSLRRILTNLQNLSLYLQTENLSLGDAHTRVESSKSTLSQLLDKEDTSVSAVLASESLSGEKLTFKGAKPAANPMESTTRELLKSLSSRFPPSKLIDATLITSFRNWPHDQSKASTYGEKEVTELYQHFGPVVFADGMVTLEDVADEWSTLRTLVLKKYPDEMKDITWGRVISELSDQNLGNVFLLVEVILALPPTSVKCETAFSAMKLLKTKRRGRLTNTRLNDLMAIKILSPSIEEFDPEPAIADWMMSTPSGQKRRMGERVKTSEKTQTSTEALVIPADDSDLSHLETESQTVTLSTSSHVHQFLKEMEDDEYESDEECDMEMEMSEDLVFSMLDVFSRD